MKTKPLRWLAIVCPIALAAWVCLLVAEKNRTPESVARVTPAAPSGSAGSTSAVPSAVSGDVVLRPLTVATSTADHAWTKDDAMDPMVIEKIVHGPEEFIRMVEENEQIKRRQLVYREQPVYRLVQASIVSGEPLRKLTLPGLDGKEVEFDIVTADIHPSGLRGSFAGRLPGRGTSMAVLSFKEGREAFSVISPEDGIYLQGHPREPGEIFVTSFDPDKYLRTPGGPPVRNANTFPKPTR
ncbi:MAG: hypothetical protein EOP85_13980 [Verrucomicrobiaceae bacterium]|nr:MAG: hypothetical protein EOP85_13980 [Verrucomicrobiaceae bacterium]